jgi:CBS-domain-containing membrane protein
VTFVIASHFQKRLWYAGLTHSRITIDIPMPIKKEIKRYINKLKGGTAPTPPQPRPLSVFWSWLGAFSGIYAVAAITFKTGVPMMIGSFGASAVLLYAAWDSPLAQPRNLLGGHLVSAIVAVAIYEFMGRSDVTIALAVATAIAAMLVTQTLHPPGGATALIAVDTMQHATFILYPVMAGAFILLIVALTVGNLSPNRHYPTRWL